MEEGRLSRESCIDGNRSSAMKPYHTYHYDYNEEKQKYTYLWNSPSMGCLSQDGLYHKAYPFRDTFRDLHVLAHRSFPTIHLGYLYTRILLKVHHIHVLAPYVGWRIVGSTMRTFFSRNITKGQNEGQSSR